MTEGQMQRLENWLCDSRKRIRPEGIGFRITLFHGGRRLESPLLNPDVPRPIFKQHEMRLDAVEDLQPFQLASCGCFEVGLNHWIVN